MITSSMDAARNSQYHFFAELAQDLQMNKPMVTTAQTASMNSLEYDQQTI